MTLLRELGKVSELWLNNTGDGDNFNFRYKLKALRGTGSTYRQSGHVSTLQAGEGSVAAEERTNDAPKLCENNVVFLEDEVSEKG